MKFTLRRRLSIFKSSKGAQLHRPSSHPAFHPDRCKRDKAKAQRNCPPIYRARRAQHHAGRCRTSLLSISANKRKPALCSSRDRLFAQYLLKAGTICLGRNVLPFARAML